MWVELAVPTYSENDIPCPGAVIVSKVQKTLRQQIEVRYEQDREPEFYGPSYELSEWEAGYNHRYENITRTHKPKNPKYKFVYTASAVCEYDVITWKVDLTENIISEYSPIHIDYAYGTNKLELYLKYHCYCS